MKRRFIPVRRFFPTPPLSSFVAAAGRQGVDPNQGKDGSRSSLDNNEWFFFPFYFATAQPLARTFLRNTDIYSDGYCQYLFPWKTTKRRRENVSWSKTKEKDNELRLTPCVIQKEKVNKKKTVAEREKYPKSQPVDCAAATNMALTPVAYSWIPSSFFADHRPDPSQFFLPLVAVALFGRLMGRQWRTGPLTSTTQTSSCSMCTNRIFREKHCVHSGNTWNRDRVDATQRE